MSTHFFRIAFLLGAVANLWVAYGFLGNHLVALAMTLVIALVYAYGALELHRFRQQTQALNTSLDQVPAELPSLEPWLAQVPEALRNPVRQRVEGERSSLPGPSLTPYLAGLLVMLGMLGTFLGMVVTLNGAVFVLEGTANLAAIRAAFAEPIKGLGLAFGTSVAGVATSAMLGLMSAISRRERLLSTQTLDALIATRLRPFSQSYQRQQTYLALQAQSQALPAMVAALQAMTLQMQRSSEQTQTQLRDQQAAFHDEVRTRYTELAHSVDQSLRETLRQSGEAVGQSVKPVLESALQGLAAETRHLHQGVVQTTQEQLQALAQSLASSTGAMAQSWSTAAAEQQQGHAKLLADVGQSLHTMNTRLHEHAQDLLATMQAAQSQQQARQSQGDQERLQGWLAALRATSATLQTEWQQATALQQTQQQQICQTLQQTAQEITAQTRQGASQTLAEISKLMQASEALIRLREASETQWAESQRQRLDQMSQTLHQELQALRQEESLRGEAAVQRLGELQSAVASHLSTLGTALEAPISRLIATASEAPRAAADVIGQMRAELSNNMARENTLLEERSRIMETLSTLLDAVKHASVEQRAAIDALVQASATAMQAAHDRFAEKVDAETTRIEGAAVLLSASAVDVASLSEAFKFAMASFQQANQQLLENLQGIEAALGTSMARSDDQLAYYVAQAREVVDLSVLSQKEIFEELRKLQNKPAARASGVEHA